MVEPPDPFEHGEFDAFEAVPRTSLSDDFRREQPDSRFGQRLVVGVAPAPPTTVRFRPLRVARCSGWKDTARVQLVIATLPM